jgi:hypothetical protein
MCHKTSSGGEREGKKVKREDKSRKEVTDFLSTQLPKNGNGARRQRISRKRQRYQSEIVPLLA